MGPLIKITGAQQASFFHSRLFPQNLSLAMTRKQSCWSSLTKFLNSIQNKSGFLKQNPQPYAGVVFFPFFSPLWVRQECVDIFLRLHHRSLHSQASLSVTLVTSAQDHSPPFFPLSLSVSVSLSVCLSPSLSLSLCLSLCLSLSLSKKNSLYWSLLYYCSVRMMWCFRQKLVCFVFKSFFL